MDISWRVIQLFLGDDGVSETSVAVHDSRKVRCSCPIFEAVGRCKHAKYVRDKIKENNGSYTVRIPEDVPDEESFAALENLDLWRDFIYKYGDIEVID